MNEEPHGRLPIAEGGVIIVLVLAVLAGGILGSPFGAFLARMTGAISRVETEFFSGLFALDRVGDALIPVVGGAVVAALVVSSPGRGISHRLSSFAPQLRTVLMFFVVGLVLFAIVPLLG